MIGACQTLVGWTQRSPLSNKPEKRVRLLSDTSVEEIDSDCCAIAGSFVYQKEHYDISMAIGERHLFPNIRKATAETVIAAVGIFCHQQIKDVTERKVQHPVIALAQLL